MRISDWSSDVCSSDLGGVLRRVLLVEQADLRRGKRLADRAGPHRSFIGVGRDDPRAFGQAIALDQRGAGGGGEFFPQLGGHRRAARNADAQAEEIGGGERSEEHTSERQSHMRIQSADYCWKKKKTR